MTIPGTRQAVSVVEIVIAGFMLLNTVISASTQAQVATLRADLIERISKNCATRDDLADIRERLRRVEIAPRP